MTRADQMKQALNSGSMSFTDLLIEAEEIGEAYEQDYENELTWFEFPDGSVACFDGSGQTINTYGSKE